MRFHLNGNSMGFHPQTQKLELQFKNSLIIHKEKTEEILFLWVSLDLIKARQNFTSNFLDENNPKSKS